MAFDTLREEALESLLRFTTAIGHRSTDGALSTWRGRKKATGESEMNNLKCYQQPPGISLSFCVGGQWVFQPSIFSFSYERK